MSVNYSEDITEQLIKEYKAAPTRSTVDILAERYQKTAKSIIGKLSREGVYRREVYVTKLGAAPVTKAEMIEDISNLLDIDSQELPGLDKAPKGTLRKLQSLVAKVVSNQE